jgi:hypothetical protein
MDKVIIVFPIPGEAEVGVHLSIVKDEGGRMKDECRKRKAVIGNYKL